MEKMLLKLAHQLDSMDEASLMSLWHKYALKTRDFEPSKRWEEACLVFSLIQAKHWKNMLFNYYWSMQRKPPLKDSESAPENGGIDLDFGLQPKIFPDKPEEKRECKILQFKKSEQKPDIRVCKNREPE